MAAVVLPTAMVLPKHRRGTMWLPPIIVVCAIEQSAIIPCYQFSALSELTLGEDLLWLS